MVTDSSTSVLLVIWITGKFLYDLSFSVACTELLTLPSRNLNLNFRITFLHTPVTVTVTSLRSAAFGSSMLMKAWRLTGTSFSASPVTVAGTVPATFTVPFSVGEFLDPV